MPSMGAVKPASATVINQGLYIPGLSKVHTRYPYLWDFRSVPIVGGCMTWNLNENIGATYGMHIDTDDIEMGLL